jgi:hypothetical protein
VYHPRNAFILGAIFVAVGILYGFLAGSGYSMDLAGATFLVVLGGVTAFTFLILLRGSRDL